MMTKSKNCYWEKAVAQERDINKVSLWAAAAWDVAKGLFDGSCPRRSFDPRRGGNRLPPFGKKYCPEIKQITTSTLRAYYWLAGSFLMV